MARKKPAAKPAAQVEETPVVDVIVEKPAEAPVEEPAAEESTEAVEETPFAPEPTEPAITVQVAPLAAEVSITGNTFEGNTLGEPGQEAVAGGEEGEDLTVLLVRYRVAGSLSCVSFSQDVYPVKSHKVDLPAGARWYADLVKSGQLVPDLD